MISGVGSGVVAGMDVGVGVFSGDEVISLSLFAGGLSYFGGSDGVLVGSATAGSIVGVISLVGSGVMEIDGSVDGVGSIVGVTSSLGVGETTSGVVVSVTSLLFGCSGAGTTVGVGVSTTASCAKVLEDIKKPGVNDWNTRNKPVTIETAF